MTKQKIVVKVDMNNNKQARKAMMIAVSVCGVESASLMGSDKDKIAVTGEAIDAIQLAKLLRKRVGCTEIVSLGPVMEDERPISRTQIVYYLPNYNNYGVRYNVYEDPWNDDSSCTIM